MGFLGHAQYQSKKWRIETMTWGKYNILIIFYSLRDIGNIQYIF